MTQTEFALNYPGFEHDRRWRGLVAPSDYVNPEPQPRYHLIVIGAGPAGLVTAIAAAGLGAKVALIERHAMGGDCLNVGCVPSKALLEYSASNSAEFESAFAWMRRVRAEIAEHDSVARYASAGVDVFLGQARFKDEGKITIGSTELEGRRIVVATGARAGLPPIPGLAESRPLTNESIFELEQQPSRLVIIGGGPIGCEMAQVFSRFGTEVHLLEAADRVLVTESREASAIIAEALTASGVTLHLGAGVEKVERRGSQIAVSADQSTVTGDELLVAAGRKPNTDDLNLAAVGVETDDRDRIIVDKYLRSTNPRVYAAGDVCTQFQFTHHADAHARIVVQNALFVPSAKTEKLIVPWCTYTDPEVAQVGPTREQLEKRATPFASFKAAYGDLDRGRAQGDSEGFVEVLVAKGSSKILGATIVGRDAGEQIAPICVAMTQGLGLDSFAKVMLPYPTRAEVLRNLADQFNRQKLTPRTRRWFGHWFRWSL